MRATVLVQRVHSNLSLNILSLSQSSGVGHSSPITIDRHSTLIQGVLYMAYGFLYKHSYK